eukprot:7966620-Pyramimonas_sp.AAC.1
MGRDRVRMRICVCVGQANHEGVCACMHNVGVPAASTDSRTPRARARSPHGRHPRHPPSPPRGTERSRTLIIRSCRS